MASLSIRTDEELIAELDYLAKMNKTDRATEARKILAEGIIKAKLELASRLYREGHSMGFSCENAHITIWDFIDYLQQTGQTIPMDYEQIKQEYHDHLKKP